MKKISVMQYQDKVTLFLNYLLVIYAFLLPFNINLSNTLFHLILLLFFFSGNLKEKLHFAFKNRVVQSLILFYFMYLVWAFSSQHFDWMLWKLKEFKYLFYIIIFLTILQNDFREKILNAFIFSVFLNEIISYLMFFNIPINFIKTTGFGPLVPFFYTYSQYVLLILIVISVLFYRMLKNKFSNTLTKIYSYATFISSSVLIFLLDSKLGYILYFALLFIVFFNTKKHLFKFKYFIGILVGIFITSFLAFNFSSTFKMRVSNMYNQVNEVVLHHKFTGSTGTRLAWDIIGTEIFLQHPILGAGGFNHIDLAIQKITNLQLPESEKNQLLIFENKITPQMQTLHNEYLDHMIQFGIIGLLILLNIFYSIYKNKAQDEEFQVLKISLLTLFMLYCFVNYFFVLSQLGIIFFLLISTTLTTYGEAKFNHPQEVNNE